MRAAQNKFQGIVLEETVPGSGDNWYIPEIITRIAWLDENVGNNNYIVWYGGLRSDIMFVKFRNDEDATLYKLTWMIEDGSNE